MDTVDIAQRNLEVLSNAHLNNIRHEVHKADNNDETIYCVDCGCEIPESRRKVVPHATRCVQCQSRYEENQNWKTRR